MQCAIRESAVEAGVWLVSPSRWLGRMAAEAFPQLRIRVIPNGVPWPDALLPRAEAKARVGLAPGAGLVLFAAHGGEAAEYKAGSQWRTIWAAIKAEIPHAVGFLVGGGGPERQGDLVLWPHVDRLTMDLFLNAADVVAYPSLADNHPLLVLEAMAQGAAVVASDVGGVAEQIVDGETGVLAASGDWRRLADEAIRLLTKPPWASRMGRTARDVGRDRFAVDRMVRDYLAVYRELLTRG